MSGSKVKLHFGGLLVLSRTPLKIVCPSNFFWVFHSSIEAAGADEIHRGLRNGVSKIEGSLNPLVRGVSNQVDLVQPPPLPLPIPSNFVFKSIELKRDARVWLYILTHVCHAASSSMNIFIIPT